jgi:hypothetical protein
MSNEIAEAAAYYLQVCREHGREFPLRNILVVTEGYQKARDKDRFVSDVSAAVHRLTAALEILDRVPAIDPGRGDVINPTGD